MQSLDQNRLVESIVKTENCSSSESHLDVLPGESKKKVYKLNEP